MKALKELIGILLTDAEDKIPASLQAAGIADFDEYVAGASRKENNKSLCVMVDPDATMSALENGLAVLFYLQLYRVDYLQALGYVDCVLSYLRRIDANMVGMTYIENITVDIIPFADNSHTLVYISVNFSEPRDSCDY